MGGGRKSEALPTQPPHTKGRSRRRCGLNCGYLVRDDQAGVDRPWEGAVIRPRSIPVAALPAPARRIGGRAWVESRPAEFERRPRNQSARGTAFSGSTESRPLRKRSVRGRAGVHVSRPASSVRRKPESMESCFPDPALHVIPK